MILIRCYRDIGSGMDAAEMEETFFPDEDNYHPFKNGGILSLE